VDLSGHWDTAGIQITTGRNRITAPYQHLLSGSQPEKLSDLQKDILTRDHQWLAVLGFFSMLPKVYAQCSHWLNLKIIPFSINL
jgi:hypothetical protein